MFPPLIAARPSHSAISDFTLFSGYWPGLCIEITTVPVEHRELPVSAKRQPLDPGCCDRRGCPTSTSSVGCRDFLRMSKELPEQSLLGALLQNCPHDVAEFVKKVTKSLTVMVCCNNFRLGKVRLRGSTIPNCGKGAREWPA